jgi:hypothetical protein
MKYRLPDGINGKGFNRHKTMDKRTIVADLIKMVPVDAQDKTGRMNRFIRMMPMPMRVYVDVYRKQ